MLMKIAESVEHCSCPLLIIRSVYLIAYLISQLYWTLLINNRFRSYSKAVLYLISSWPTNSSAKRFLSWLRDCDSFPEHRSLLTNHWEFIEAIAMAEEEYQSANPCETDDYSESAIPPERPAYTWDVSGASQILIVPFTVTRPNNFPTKRFIALARLTSSWSQSGGIVFPMPWLRQGWSPTLLGSMIWVSPIRR